MNKLVLLFLVGGCAEGAFSAHARDNSVEDLRRVLAVSKAPAPWHNAMAFLVTQPDRQLVGWDLAAQKAAWTEKAEVKSRVYVGRGVIAHRQGANQIAIRDAKSGAIRGRVTLAGDEKFVGAAFDDERLHYVIQKEGQQRVSYVVGVNLSGSELWRTPASGSLGRPAARGGVVAAPFSYQWLVFLDGMTGKELARVRATDEQVTFVRTQPDGFYYGGDKGVYRLDEKSAQGSRKGSNMIEAKLGAEVRTHYYYDGYQTAQADYTAFDRNRLLWRTEARGDGIGFVGDEVYLFTYRYLFAVDSRDGKFKWAYAHPRVDVAAAQQAGDSLLLCANDGELVALDSKTGGVQLRQKTGLRVFGASFDAESVPAAGPGEPTDLIKALEKIVWDPDARFNAVKSFAVMALGATPGSAAGLALLKIVRAGQAAVQSVQKRAGEELVARKDASLQPQYLEALAEHEDFLADKHPRGLDVLARLAAALGLKEAVPELAAHLRDPATPQTALKDVVVALGRLGGKDAARALQSFLLTYRADPMFIGDPAPLVAAAEGLLAAGVEERRVAQLIASDSRTISSVQQALKGKPQPK
jgi:hypothetical protein